MNKKLTIGTIITLVLAISGTYFIAQEDNAYYCEDKDVVMICEKLSQANDYNIQTRCYFSDTYKVCNTGWEMMEIGKEINYSRADVLSGKKYLCDQIECLLIEESIK